MRSNTHTQLERLQAMPTASLEVVCKDGSMRYLSAKGTGDTQSGNPYDTIILELVGIRVVALYRDGDEVAGFARYLPQEAIKRLPCVVREAWGEGFKFVETPSWEGQPILTKLFEAASEGGMVQKRVIGKPPHEMWQVLWRQTGCQGFAPSEGCQGCKDTSCSLNGGTTHPSIMCGCDACVQRVVREDQEECRAASRME